MGDIAEIIVRLFGGFWKFRMKLKKAGNIQRKYLLIIYNVYLNKYGAFIAPSANITSEPCFPHNIHGVFIAGGANIGKNCTIFQHVTIGANSLPFSSTIGSPTVGDNCYIGAGSVIVGAVKVGDNCRIGANSTIAEDVPDNSTVVNGKPRVIKSELILTNKYYRWSKNGPLYFDEGEWILEKNQEIIDSLEGNL